MKTSPASVAEITATAITLLCREIGVVDTARFMSQFTPGFGNYTKERDHIVGNATVDELIAEMKARREKGNRRRKTSRKQPRPTRL